MDIMQKITDLRARRAELVANATKLLDEGKLEEAKAARMDAEQVASAIEEYEAQAKLSAGSATPAAAKEEKVFRSFGEQMQAVARARKTGIVDERLLRVNNTTGIQEAVAADGGYAVETQFAGDILESAVKRSPLLDKVSKFTVGDGANGARWVQLDETNIGTHIAGGVQAYWVAEAGSITASKPQFRQTKIDLEKLCALCYVTDEMLQDATFMDSFMGQCCTLAVERALENAIINGSGTTQPLGVLNSNALVTVAKKSGQTADTIVAENILAMWNRSDFSNRSNLVWVAHPDVEEQLSQMAIANTLLWMPEGGLAEKSFQTLRGREIIYSDCCAALGDKGDIILMDPTQYMLLNKGGAKQDWSMHVEFLSDQMAFRIVMRCNGAPMVNSALTVKNSTNTRSPFVTLAARA